jgi:hypothetical protein
VALFAAVAIVNLFAGREDLRAGSREENGPPVAITSVPTTYTATFRVETRAGKTPVVTTERYWVRRPFEARIETWSGPPPGKDRLSVRQSAFGVLTNENPRSQPINIAVPPSVATGDLRVDAGLDEALKSHTIIRRERRRVYGRPCQIYRAGGPVSAGDFAPYKAGVGEYADFCVDRSGLVIEEAWTSRGRLVRRRVAVKVEVDPPIDPEIFRITVPPTDAAQRGSVKQVDVTEPVWTPSRVPTGFRLLGHYRVALPQIAIPQSGGSPTTAPVSLTDVYVNGPDLLAVDQGASLAGLIASDNRPARSIDLGSLKNGQLVIDARMSEARGAAPDGSAVRVLGTLAPSELVQLARGMVKK